MQRPQSTTKAPPPPPPTEPAADQRIYAHNMCVLPGSSLRARTHARSTRPPQETFSTSARRASLRSLLPARAGRRRFACTSRSSHSGGRQKAIHSRADARTSSESDGTPPPLVREAAAEPFPAAAPAAATSPPPLPLFPQPPRPCRASGSESPKFGKVLQSTHPSPDGRCSRGISSRGPQMLWRT